MGTEEPTPDSMLGRNLGAYRIERRLGRGGMGEVYLARDTALDRPVAVKFLLASHAQLEVIVRRFQREARAAARINHPNIVHVHAVGEDDGRPYIVMEYVDGAPLDAMLRQHERFTWQRALSIGGQVASALECAHAAGIVHRDIKPANILVDRYGRVHVSDFGVAKLAETGTQLTSDGMFIGTPQYMSPEQCGVGTVGPQSDLFSLGATVYEMIAGTVPFRAETPAALIRKITLEGAPPLQDMAPEVPGPVCAVVDRMLARDPAERYGNATELLQDLHRLKDTVSGAGTMTFAEGKTGKGVRVIQTRESWFTFRRLAIGGLVILGILMTVPIVAHFRRARQLDMDLRESVGSTSEPGPGSSSQPGTRRPDPTQMFKRMDRTGDRRLDRTEFPEKLKGRFEEFDANRDGYVDEAEFSNGLRQLRRAGPPGPPQR